MSRTRVRLQKIFTEPTRTKQSFGNECNINTIMRRYYKTGVIEHLRHDSPRYLDLSNATDYLDAILTVQAAEDAFMELPALVREHFANDPAVYLAAFHDPDRRPELQELGLVLPEAPEPAVPVPSPEPAEPVPDKP